MEGNASISLEDQTVPGLVPLDEIKSAVGVDVGLKEFLTTSDGETEPVQQNFRRSQKQLALFATPPGSDAEELKQCSKAEKSGSSNSSTHQAPKKVTVHGG